MRRLSSHIAAACVIAGAILLIAPAQPAGAACASTTKSLAGTVEGEDGRFMSAQVGIELFDSAGRKLKMDGCVMTAGGYSVSASVNIKPATVPCCYILPGSGTTEPTYNGYTLSKHWSVSGLPSNAATAWLEVYPKRAGGAPNTDSSRYGRALRRPIPVSSTSVDIDLPLRCGLTGNGVTGATGSIEGRAFIDGKQVGTSRVGAWSQEPDTEAKILGWSLDGARVAGQKFFVDPLAPGTYSVIVSGGGLSKQIYNVKVLPCQVTRLDVALRGSVPPPPSAVDRPVAGDWDGDGDQEPGRFTPGGGWNLRASSEVTSSTIGTFVYGKGVGDIPVVGDWDGDGDDDSGIFRAGGTWLLRSPATGATMTTFSFGRGAGDRPVVGDWNGDGIDDFGILRPGGTWFLRLSTGGTLPSVVLGTASGDRPVAGDWDNDGDDEPGIYRKGGAWYLRTTSGASNAQLPVFSFGVGSTDLPVVGDWDGDGDATPGIYRRGAWHLRSAVTVSATTQATFVYGH